MKEYILSNLGYFTVNEAETIKKSMNNKSFMNFEVGYSNFAGNCTLIIKTNYQEDNPDITDEDIKSFFMGCLATEFAKLASTHDSNRKEK